MTIRKVDLRSDTVTKPTEEMWAAMATAEVDDDIVAFDPTAFQFETEMARIMGKESALFVPSGTMGNLISVLVHCEIRGSEVIVQGRTHVQTMWGDRPRSNSNLPKEWQWALGTCPTYFITLAPTLLC